MANVLMGVFKTSSFYLSFAWCHVQYTTLQQQSLCHTEQWLHKGAQQKENRRELSKSPTFFQIHTDKNKTCSVF